MSLKDILLITDMDGTLLGRDFKIPQRNIEAVHRFMDQGGNFAIATGRSKMSGAQYFRQTNPNAPCVLLNGAVLYDFRKKELLMKRCLPSGAMEYLERIEGLFPEIGIEVYTDEEIYITRDSGYVQKHIENENLNCLFQTPGGNVSVCKGVFAGEPQLIQMISDYCLSHPIPGVRFVASGDIYFEMLPEGVDKGLGLKELILRTNFRRENVFAIGDYFNDLELLKEAGVSAVPENAPEKLKAVADYTVCHCYDGAVADFIGLIEEKYS